MKKLLLVAVLTIFAASCASLNKFSQQPNKSDVKTANFAYTKKNISSTTNPRTEDLYQGMSMTLVKDNLGEPQKMEEGEDGLIVWVYPNTRLYFLEDILFVWK